MQEENLENVHFFLSNQLIHSRLYQAIALNCQYLHCYFILQFKVVLIFLSLTFNELEIMLPYSQLLKNNAFFCFQSVKNSDVIQQNGIIFGFSMAKLC